MFKCTYTSTQGTDFQGFFRQIPAEGEQGAIDAVCEGSVVFGDCDEDPNHNPGATELPKAKWEFTTGPGDTFPLWFCNSCIMKFITKGLRGRHIVMEIDGDHTYECLPFITATDGIADDDAKYQKGDLLVMARPVGSLEFGIKLTPGTAYSTTDLTHYIPDA